MEIRIQETEILNGDISQVKTTIENLALDSSLSADNEDKVVIKFSNFRPLDLSRKLQEQAYRAWFRKLDSEFPYLPFFLSRQSATLMFFIMGNTDFTIDDQNSVNFDDMSKQHYISRKKSSIKAFCLSHNIDPRAALQRLNSFEPQINKVAPQKIRIEEQLNQYGSVAYMTEQREYVISILIKKIPQDIKILGAYYTEKNCPQPFFTVFMEEDGERNKYTVFSQISQRETEEYFRMTPFAMILIVFRNDNGQLTAFPKIKTKITIATLEELEEQKNFILSPQKQTKHPSPEEESLPEPETQAPEEEKRPAEPEKAEEPVEPEPVETFHETSLPNEEPEVPEKIVKKTVEETVPENETMAEKIIRLETENALLREQKASLKKIIEDLEEEINKKRSFWSIIKRLFS